MQTLNHKEAATLSQERKNLASRVNFKQHLKNLVSDNKIVKQLSDKINLQRLVIKMNEECEDTLKVDIEREFLRRKRIQENSRPILLQGGPQLRKNYFIKREFITVNPVNQGISGKLIKNDIKHYFAVNSPNYQEAIAESMQVKELDGLMEKFFSQTKGMNLHEIEQQQHSREAERKAENSYKFRINKHASLLNLHPSQSLKNSFSTGNL